MEAETIAVEAETTRQRQSTGVEAAAVEAETTAMEACSDNISGGMQRQQQWRCRQQQSTGVEAAAMEVETAAMGAETAAVEACRDNNSGGGDQCYLFAGNYGKFTILV